MCKSIKVQATISLCLIQVRLSIHVLEKDGKGVSIERWIHRKYIYIIKRLFEKYDLIIIHCVSLVTEFFISVLNPPSHKSLSLIEATPTK